MGAGHASAQSIAPALDGSGAGCDLDERDAAARRWLASRSFFAVVGAMKSGTCALRYHLRASTWEDNSCIPAQELHFFDDDEEFRKGAAHYRSWFEWDKRWPPPDVVGDVTPSYLYIPEALPRLRQLIPQARLVAILRNPVERFASQHNHDLAKGRPVGSMHERLKRELLADEARADRAPSRSDAFARGLYGSQLRRLLDLFPRGQLLAVVSERYRRSPLPQLRRIRAFLGLDPDASGWDSASPLPESHVRGPYAEELPEADRARLRALYAQEVADLRALLADALPEWGSDFPLPPCTPAAAPADGTAREHACKHARVR